MPFLFFTLLDPILVLAGHGYDFRSTPAGESGGGDDGGGIGMVPIVAVVVLALVTVGIMVWLSRRDREPGAEGQGRALKLTSVAPLALTVAVIATPLVVWTASSGGDDERSLMVERFTSVTGAPELLVSLGDDDLNNLEATGGRRTVRVICRGRQGQPVLDSRQKWPFVEEAGYDYPHAHQAATPEQVQQADRCRVDGGARVSLEADVEGSLTG